MAACVHERWETDFQAIFGGSRGGGREATVADEPSGKWFQYMIFDRVKKGTFASGQARPPRYRNRAQAERGAASLCRRFPFYETEVRGDETDGWQVFCRKLPGY
jgi:hypothetical protein